MPIDIISHGKLLFNKFANKTSIGCLMGNPIFIGIIIALIMMMINYFFVTKQSTSFKALFYMFIVSGILLYIHDNIIRERLNEQLNIEKVESIAPSEDYVTTVQPRSVSELSDLPDIDYKPPPPPQRMAMGAGYHTMQTSAFAGTPTTADDLINLVQGV
jgi:hypothetical protein